MMNITKDYLLLTRNITKNERQCLVFFLKEVKNLKKIAFKIKSKNCKKCYVFCNSKFHLKASYILTILNNFSFSEKIYFDECLPLNDMTREPTLCPVTFQEAEEWKNVNHLVVIPNNGWDFYENEWILQRWESALGIFDYDNFWIASSYPLDLYNKPVHFNIVLFYIKLCIQNIGVKAFKLKYFALYQFYKDKKLGKLLLEFFHEETLYPTQNKEILYQKIHKIYHSISSNHPYRRFLFYNSYCLTSKHSFKLNLYIQQYLSFHGMFVCQNFCNLRKSQLISGIEKNNQEFYNFFKKKEENLFSEIQSLHNHYNHIFQWVGKDTIQKMKSPFWKYIYRNWNYCSRNINLWDIRVITYNDNQNKIGEHLLSLFPIEWIRNFDDKKYKIQPTRKKKN